MKKFLVAMDSFKGCLTSAEAGHAVSEGIKSAIPDADISSFTVADGGEGMMEALTNACNGTFEEVRVTGPLDDSVNARYGIYIKSDGSKCAIIEMASAAGLTLVPEDKRNPLVTTTYGVGEMISDAYKKGCRSFIIGIGGSATNDAGIGMLSALGFIFIDKDGHEVSRGAEGVRDVYSVLEIKAGSGNKTVTPDILRKCKFTIACDVNNPLYGDDGCSMVFSLQKGATHKQAKSMDGWIECFARLIKKQYPNADENANGAGAAGGLGYAFKTFLDAELKSGIDIVLSETGFVKTLERIYDDILKDEPEIILSNELKNNVFVITGEGKLDAQTAMGKVPAGVAKYAKKYGARVIAFGGTVEESAADLLKSAGIDECYAITVAGMPIETAMRKEIAMDNLKKKTSEVLSAL